METMMILGLISAVLMGMTLGVFGAGGSILTVPILVFLMGVSASEATAYSLFIVGVTAVFGAYTYYKQDLIQFKIGFVFAIPAFIGVYSVRLFLMPALPEHIASIGSYDLSKDALVLIVFSLIMIMAAYAMIKPSKVESTEQNKTLNFPLIAVEGLVVGGVTGFVGAGGGFLIIPALVILAGLSMKQAVGTSLMIIAFKSLLGFVGDIQAGLMIDWTLLLQVVGLSIVGVFIGERIARKVDGNKLKPAFGYFVLVMGIGILIREILI
ncbi:MAG: sulfite exporter TauE/SafE family protein [Ghiorsea sp.]|nr:sulfite exporter TauE/SafE family protein [Ghiorsea sp.]MDQ7057164.1 sulfite exporter TauE/SafE family protein [Ghiorsea sp.]